MFLRLLSRTKTTSFRAFVIFAVLAGCHKAPSDESPNEGRFGYPLDTLSDQDRQRLAEPRDVWEQRRPPDLE